jgi:carbonic anhydrase
MSVIDQALKANELYAKTYDPKWGAGPPKPKLAVVLAWILGSPTFPGFSKHADIDVIRTGGPAVTEDVLAELLVSTRVLGSKEIMLLNHTGCGPLPMQS